MIIANEKVLVLAPHTDDGEFGCGATMAKMAENGCKIYCAVFSICEDSVPAGYPKDVLQDEFLESMLSLGVRREHTEIFNYRVRRFNERRQDVLEDMIRLRKKINPTVVFAPSLHDIHQDHLCIAQEAVRAFKNRTLLAYEMPWNHLVFSNQLFISLNRSHLDVKLRALSCYKSQAFRTYSNPDVVLGQARCRGVQGGVEYAELFEVVRMSL